MGSAKEKGMHSLSVPLTFTTIWAFWEDWMGQKGRHCNTTQADVTARTHSSLLVTVTVRDTDDSSWSTVPHRSHFQEAWEMCLSSNQCDI